MRKQTKLVAVLSAAALLAMGASMTSFAAGWEKDDAGVWHYYDSDDEMVTGEWKKDGGKWFHLDDEGDMETNTWVDDDYYVAEDGHMLTNEWKKTVSDDDQDDPDEDGESWCTRQAGNQNSWRIQSKESWRAPDMWISA